MKLFFKISGITLFLIVIGALVFLYMLDLNRYKPRLEQVLSVHAGREVRIDGEIDISPSLTPVITLRRIRMAGTPWAAQKDMVTAEYVQAKVSLPPLLTGAIHVKRFTLYGTRIHLQRHIDPEPVTTTADRPPPLPVEPSGPSLPC